jgi:hypothetical protein
MGHDLVIATKERDRAALLKEAARIVDTADKQGKPLTESEDACVVELVKRAQELETEIGRLSRDRKNIVR